MDNQQKMNKTKEQKFQKDRNKAKVKVYTNKKRNNTSETVLIEKLKERYETVIKHIHYL